MAWEHKDATCRYVFAGVIELLQRFLQVQSPWSHPVATSIRPHRVMQRLGSSDLPCRCACHRSMLHGHLLWLHQQTAGMGQ